MDFVYQALDTKRYTISEGFATSIRDSLKTTGIQKVSQKVREIMPWYRKEPERIELEKQLEIIKCMTPEQQLNPILMSMESKAQLAKVSGAKYEEVNKLIRQFVQARAIHEWINARARTERPIPSTQKELFEQMRIQPSPRSFELMVQGSITRARGRRKKRQLVNFRRFVLPWSR